MRVAVLGGGGFRTPLVWEAIATVARAVRIDAVVLQDTSAARLARIAAVIEGMRRSGAEGPPVRTTTALEGALEGVDVVFCALRVGGLEGRVVDERVPLELGVLGQETVGPGGICFALRTVPVMLEVARVVRARAPAAWVLNFTNPAGLVTEALRPVLGDRVVGICDSPAALCARVAAALGRSVRTLEFDYAGLNHLGWLLGVRQRGRDLLPGLLADDRALEGVEEARLFGATRLRELGAVPNEYVVYVERPERIVAALRKAGWTRAETLRAQQAAFYDASDTEPAAALLAWRAARDARFDSYMSEVWGDAEWSSVVASGPRATTRPPAPVDEGPGEAGYGAIAAAFLRAVAGEKGERLVVDVANRGALPFLDADAVVELPCRVTPAGVVPEAVSPLPAEQRELVATVKEVERTTIRAAIEGSRALALEALATHPVVPSRATAEAILAGYLDAFPGLAAALR